MASWSELAQLLGALRSGTNSFGDQQAAQAGMYAERGQNAYNQMQENNREMGRQIMGAYNTLGAPLAEKGADLWHHDEMRERKKAEEEKNRVNHPQDMAGNWTYKGR